MPLFLNSNKNKEKITDYITDQCSKLVEAIESNREELEDELLKYESYETARNEISYSLDCLKNISKEYNWLSSGKVDLLCSVIPINLPLYSLIIFAIVPGFMTNEVVVRSPILMRSILQKIAGLLELKKLMPQIKFTNIERNLFAEAYISIADVIIFTGRYKNAKLVQESCPDALFIYDGSGINPLVITDSADIELAVKKTIDMRVFNSGQDCAGPDAILVHKKVLDTFKQNLLVELKKIKVGDYKDREVRVGQIIKTSHLPAVQDFFDAHSKFLVYGGTIDFQSGIVYPTVIIEDIRAGHTPTMTEFFAPVFYILSYQDDQDLKNYFSQESYKDFAMHVSIFGNTPHNLDIPNSIILQNQIVNDIEQGNDPYGGYGPKANYVSYDGVYHHRPLLISREIAMYIKERSAKTGVVATHSVVQ